VICAEPLTHVAYGPCGHRDACVECVARLRFVMDDERCVICQQRCPSMFATRAMGDYTETIGAEAFAELPGRARSRELHHDKKLNIFFDDLAVCRKVEQLRGLSCPVCAAEDGSASSKKDSGAFGSLKQLKAHLRETHDRFFCEVCLEGRKVFVSQQVTYSRQDLDRHKRGAAEELDAPLGGFAGHPACRFCRKNFYDEGAMYHHMQSAHETCHLCRRAAPDTFVYYRDYDELERHYNAGHHPCLHPECLAKKFVVFQSPQELKNHEGLEHGRAMTKAERKEALRVHVDFGANERGQSRAMERDPRDRNEGASAEDDRRRRAAREMAARAAGSASAAERAQLEAVLMASRGEETNAGITSMPRPPSMEEFPDLRQSGGGASARRGGGNLVAGGWAGRARGARGASVGGGDARVGGAEDFPSLSSRVGGANPPRSSQHTTRRQPAPMPELPVRAAEHLAARLAGLAAGRLAGPGSGPPAPPAPGPGDFPTLGGAGRLAGAPVSPGPSSRAFPMSTADKLAMQRSADARRLAPSPPPAEPEFRRVGGRGGRGGRWNSNALDLRPADGRTEPALSRTNEAEAARSETEHTSRVATEEKAAETAARNDRLVAAVRAALERRGASFDVFANVSSQFKDGKIAASAYLAKVSAMGIDLEHVKELARLMPDENEQRRMELFRAIAARERVAARTEPKNKNGGTDSVDAAAALLFGGGNANDAGKGSSGKGSSSGLGPPTWDCPACTFRNQAASARCDVCDGARGGVGVSAAAGAAGPGSDPGARGGGKGGKGKKKAKGTKISLTAVGGAGVGGLDEFIPGREKAAWGT
jgi:hypothetical protein